MNAKIMKINKDTVVLKNSNGKFATISKDELSFDYSLGDTINVDFDGENYYFLPKSKDEDFWSDAKEENSSTKKKAKNKNLKGVSGWLAFYIVSLVIAVLSCIRSIIYDIDVLNSCSSICDSYLDSLLALEIALNIGICIFLLFVIYYISMKKKDGIMLAIILEACMLGVRIIDLILASQANLPLDDASNFAELLGAIARCAIWISYFKKSERVRLTLVEK